MKSKRITTWEAACIVTGYGIGGGVLAMPYLASKTGLIGSIIILVLALAGSYLLHLMIADLAIKAGPGSQIVEVFSKFLFRGKLKNVFTIMFFVLMAIVLVSNLAAYVAGSGEVIGSLIPVSTQVGRIIFYVMAATVVLFGLKAVAVSEKVMVAIMFGLIAVLAVASIMKGRNEIPLGADSFKAVLAFFGMAMLAYGAYFSIPQVVEGLDGDQKKIKKAVFLGMNNNFILMIIVIICALLASAKVTEVGMVGWSEGIGLWAQIIGSVFTLAAMLTTYWSISLALGDIVRAQFGWNDKLCWVFATLPSLILAVLNIGGFLDFLEIAGGAIAILVALLVIPCFLNARKEVPGSIMGKWNNWGAIVYVFVTFVLMAVGNLI